MHIIVVADIHVYSAICFPAGNAEALDYKNY